MAYEIPGFSRSYTAGADLSAQQFKFVKFSGATVISPAAVTEAVVGVLQNKPTSGQAGTVMISGVTRVKAGAVNLVAGAECYILADGSVTQTKSTQTGAVGIAETATTNIGDTLSLLLKPLGTYLGTGI